MKIALLAGSMGAWEASVTTGTPEWWSERMFELHGLQPGSNLPPDYYALIHPEDRLRVRDSVASSVRDHRNYAVQYRVCWPDGSIHWLEGSGTPLPGDSGEGEVMIGVCVNIDQRKAERAHLEFLAKASSELAALTDYSATMRRIAELAVPHFADWCAVDMLEQGGVLRRVAVAHVDPEKVALAHELHRRFPPSPEDPGGTWHVIRTGRPELVPVITPGMLSSVSDPEYRSGLDSLGLHSYMGVPILAQGSVLGVISFITSESRRVFSDQDLTKASDLAARAAVAIRNAELMEDLRRSDTAKDVFLATLAHELRNPLAPIVNSLELLSRSQDPSAALAQVLPVIQRQTGQLGRLVDDLLDLARITSGKIELRREELDVRDVLRTAVESCQPLIDRCRHTLAVEFSGEPAWVSGDPVRIAQIFSNLLNNAAKYTPPGGRIELRMSGSAEEVRVVVSDNGQGMSAEFLPRTFDLFTQGSDASQPSHQGLGIGLYLVRGLVEMHGGSVTASSDGPGKGSRFTVTLPRIAPPADRVTPETQEPGIRTGRKVLVVDDNVDAAETLAYLLEALGHSPTTATTGAAGLEKCLDTQPDVVLLDIGLPDVNGYEVARRIRSSPGQRPRLIALTGWGQAEDKARAMRAGFDEHWTKPVDPKKLQGL